MAQRVVKNKAAMQVKLRIVAAVVELHVAAPSDLHFVTNRASKEQQFQEPVHHCCFIYTQAL